MKYILALVSTLVLTACGGGGGGSSTPVPADGASVGVSYSNLGASIVTGHFGADSSQYIVTTSIRYLGAGATEPGPVRVFRVGTDGVLTDQTVSVLGGATTVFTSVPVVADFNRDGIDDIFLPGFTDTQNLTGSVAFISRAGQSHQRVELPDPVWAHGATAIDVNGDGNIDVVDAWGEAWLNDGQGNFTFRTHTYQDRPGLWMHGSGVCAGDFGNTGRSQLVITDLMVDANKLPIADTVIFELDAQGLPTAQHSLPVPVLDRNSVTERSHDVACKVADFNGDGRLDILVLSRPWAQAGQSWSNQGQAQLLINRGNWQFDDVTDTALVGFNTSVLISYTPVIADFNGDGRLDIWFGYFDYNTGQANQLFLNSGSEKFARAADSLINAFSASGGMIPVKIGSQWALLYATMNLQINTSTFYITKPVYSF